MTSRERVLQAIRHKEPDKIPVDLGGMRSTGITAIAYGCLKKFLGLSSGATYVYDIVQQLAQPEQEVLDIVESDVIDLGRAFLTEESDWKDFTLKDGAQAKIPSYIHFTPHKGGWMARNKDGLIVGEMPKDAFYVNQTHFPLKDWDGKDTSVLKKLPEQMDRVTWAALPSPPWHKPLTPEHLADIRKKARYLYETTDYAVMASFGGNLLEWGEYLCRMDQFLFDIVDNPGKVCGLLDRLVEIHLENIEKFLDAIEGFVQIIQMGDDLGTQQAPIISPRTYRKLFKPRHRLIYERVKRRTGMHLFLHSCGAIAEMIPDLIEIGVEIINPVQTSARGMDPEKLKREYGKDLTFWGGGCDTQQSLPHLSSGDIREHVRQRLEIFSKGGGFVFTPVHNILPNIPPESIVAMYDEVKRYS